MPILAYNTCTLFGILHKGLPDMYQDTESILPAATASGVLQVTAYRAGHVLGACMFEIEIAGMRLLYTGDYSRVPDRHLSAADTPQQPPHIGQPLTCCNDLHEQNLLNRSSDVQQHVFQQHSMQLIQAFCNAWK